MDIKVKKLNSNAVLPTKAHETDAGFDLYLPKDREAMLLPRGTRKIAIGLAIEIPEGYYAQLRDRSSLASKGVHIHGGVIDSGYRDEWQVVFHCTNINGYEFSPGDKIAQFTLHEVPLARIVEVDTLSKSDRGTKGFGSSGA
jgi:dUTP pyrophosphatase